MPLPECGGLASEIARSIPEDRSTAFTKSLTSLQVLEPFSDILGYATSIAVAVVVSQDGSTFGAALRHAANEELNCSSKRLTSVYVGRSNYVGRSMSTVRRRWSYQPSLSIIAMPPARSCKECPRKLHCPTMPREEESLEQRIVAHAQPNVSARIDLDAAGSTCLRRQRHRQCRCSNHSNKHADLSSNLNSERLVVVVVCPERHCDRERLCLPQMLPNSRLDSRHIMDLSVFCGKRG